MITTETKERSLTLSTWEVRAVLEEKKRQFRRVAGGCTVRVRGMTAGLTGPDTDHILFDAESGEWYCEGGLWHKRCPFGRDGDKVWVRETWVNNFGMPLYRADCHPDSFEYGAKGWKSPLHMPRALSRITLEIKSVVPVRLQDITEEDAEQEGIATWAAMYCSRLPEDELYARAYFELMWGQTNRAYPWESNPFVWTVSIDRR